MTEKRKPDDIAESNPKKLNNIQSNDDPVSIVTDIEKDVTSKKKDNYFEEYK